MSFKEALKGITDAVKGARGAVISGMDGIPVDEYITGPGADMGSVGAEYGNVLKVATNAAVSLGHGPASEMTLSAGTGVVVMRMINDDYFVALLMGSGGNIGKGRFALRRAANALKKEF